MLSILRTLPRQVMFLLLVFSCHIMAEVSSPTQFIYCYETTELLPHFTGNSLKVPKKNPGAAIEILQELDARLAEVKITFVRRPWLRCLRDLAAGKVTAVIGSYSAERGKFASFPYSGGKLDKRFAFSKTETCLLQQKSAAIDWDGKKYTFEKKHTIAIPRGYKLIKNLQAHGFDVYKASSANNAHELLFTRRVAASVSLCDFTAYPEYIVKNPIPIRTHHGYLMFSKVFFREYSKLGDHIWQVLKGINKGAFYLKYQNYSMVAHN